MGKKRILIIDNRPENIRQPVLRLQLAGYEVYEAGSGRIPLVTSRFMFVFGAATTSS